MRNKQSLRKVSLGAITLLAAGFLLWAKAADPSRRSETTPLNVDSFVGLPGQTSTLLPDGEALLLGGEGTKGSVALAGIENPGNAQVTFLPTTMLQARAWHSATVLPDGSVVIFGGVGADGHVVKTVELFDLATKQFKSLVITGILPRAHQTATLLTDGNVFLVGGVDSNNEVMGSGQTWNPRTNNTTDLPQLLITARTDHTAKLQSDGTVLLWGGKDASGLSLQSGEIYDPAAQQFLFQAAHPGTDRGSAQIVETVPEDGSQDVPSGALIAVRFSRAVRVQSVNVNSVTLSNSDGSLPAKVVAAEAGMLAFVTPAQSLAPDTSYIVELKGINTTEGSALPDFSFNFSTGAADGSSTTGTVSGGLETSRYSNLPPLKAPPGVTAISGQVLLQNGLPLNRVTLRVGARRTATDTTGRFLVRDLPSGHQVLVIDGRTANTRKATYGVFEVGVDVAAGQTNVLGYKVWMPVIDTSHAATIAFPTSQETVVTNPVIPGLELHLPAGTTVTDIDGKVANQISITPIPLSQPPFPLPSGVRVPIYFTIQPGGGYIAVSDPKGPKGGWLVYPNTFHEPPSSRFNFWDYDADDKGWFVYGQGKVSANGQSVIPDPGVLIYELTGAMVGSPSVAPSNGPCNCSEEGGDPVDLGTGLFVYRSVDLYEPDVIPIVLTRTYRQRDSATRDFGVGTQNSYDMYLVGDYTNYQYAELVLADGSQINYPRISPGTSFFNAVLQNQSAPGPFFGSSMAISCGNTSCTWTITQKDGTTSTFLDFIAPPKYQQNGVTSIRDRHGNTLSISRDSNYNISRITSPNGRWVQFTYDSNSRVTQVQDQIGRTVSYVYDASGRLSQVTDANNGLWQYGYDSNNNMTSITDPRGIAYLQNQYDSNGRVSLQTHVDGGTYHFAYTTDQNGNIAETDVTDPNGNVRKVTFSAPPSYPDGFITGGTPSSDTYAAGTPQQQIFTNQYQANTNLLTSVTDPLGRNTSYTYDSGGNTTSVTRLAGTSNAVTTRFTHDSTYSQLTSVLDPLQRLTTFSLDSSGNVTSTTDSLGNSVPTFTYDTEGRVLTATDAGNETTSLTYTGADLTSTTDPLNRTINLARDGAGRLLGITTPLGHVIQYSYNAFDQVTSITDPLGDVMSFTFDGDRNLLSVTDPQHSSNPTTYAYDNMDRLQTRTDPLNHSESYVYDRNGNVTQLTDRRGKVTTYSYDALNRLTFAGFGTQAGPSYESTKSYSYDSADRLTQAFDSVAGTFSRTYDGFDQLTQEQGPEGTLGYVYDAAGRRTQMTVSDQSSPVTYAYDNDDRLTGIVQGSSYVSFGYDATGRRTSLTLPNGIVVGYAYDKASQLTGLTYSLAGNVLGNLTYGYDQDARRIQMGGTWARTGMPNSTTAVYNAANQLTNWNGATLIYDANGNMTSDGGNTYAWDARNQLASISGGSSGSFIYDPFGRRFAKTVNGATTNFLYDGLNPVQELSGSTPTANLLSGGLDEYFTRVDSTGTANFLTNGLGSTLALTSASGAAFAQYTYESFGNTTPVGGPTNPYQYTGRENDGTGLFYYRARYYDPAIGRFLSEDPLREDSGSPNLYSYLSNDPVNAIDPFGLARCTYSVTMHTMVCEPDADGFQPAIIGPNGAGAVQLGPDGVASGGSMQGPTACTNNLKCVGIFHRNEGPIVPDGYKMNFDTRPIHQGMNVYRLEPWPHHWYEGELYKMHLARGGFELHLGTVSLGCINAQKKNPGAAQQYQQLLKLLQSEDGSNYLTVIP